MSEFQIQTAQEVSIQQPLAGIGTRIAAWFVDFSILVIYAILSTIVFSSLDFTQWVSLMLTLPILFYHLLFEVFMQGQTLGKRAMGIRVVKIDGSKPGIVDYLLRWLLRIIDVTITSGGLAVFLILWTEKRQRLGDIAGNTSVVYVNKLSGYSILGRFNLPKDYKPEYPQVKELTDLEFRKFEKIFRNAVKNQNDKAMPIIAEKLAQKLNLSYNSSPKTFIQKVLNDYIYFTNQD